MHIVVTDEFLGNAVCGLAQGPGDYLGGPNVIEEILIVNSCIEKERYILRSTFIEFEDGSFFSTVPEWLEEWEAPADIVPMLRSGVELVAHELGHGVNLYHPGYSARCGGHTADPVRGSVFSGPDDNLMRYTGPGTQYIDGKCYDFPSHLDNAPQTAFVKKLKGSGINAGSLKKIEEEDGSEYWLPMAGDASCTGTLITNMSLNQDKTTSPPGC
ncbi:MAG TPA: hypothetical protein EYG38_11455 [Verrucomicrobia bacterium]|nr:hypothetical protein [Verrucomicrobiota bacterium]